MVEFQGQELTFVLIFAVLAFGALAYFFYKKSYQNSHHPLAILQNLLQCETTYVVLQDFDNHFKILGKLKNYVPNSPENEFRLEIEELDGEVYEWTIQLDTKYNFASISRNYDKFLIIWGTSNDTDFQNRVIKPLFHMDIIKIGLTHSLKAIKEEDNSQKEYIKNLEQTNKTLQEALRNYQTKSTLDNLKYSVELGESNNQLIEVIKKQYKTYAAMGVVKGDHAGSTTLGGLKSDITKKVGEIESIADATLKKAQNAAKPEESEA